MSTINTKYEKKEIIYQLLLAVIIVALYSTSWKYSIFPGLDDGTYILRNPHLSFSLSNIAYWFKNPCVGNYLPVTMLSFMFDHAFWGFNSFGYHLQNIFWHIIATLAIYNCFRLFNIKSCIAFFICLIFAIHPQRIESVVWLSERKDVLCTAFYFLSIYFYIKNYDKRFSFMAFICFIISMLSKSMAISLPAILLLYEFYRQKNFNIKHYAGKLWPYFIVILIFIPIAIIAQGEATIANAQIPLLQKVYTVFHNLYWYFKQTIFPMKLNPAYPIIVPSYSIIDVSLFYFGVLFLTIVAIFKDKFLFLYNILPLSLAYIISLLPVIGILRLGSIDHADRYSYIPSVFIWFAIALILSKLLSKGKTPNPHSRDTLHVSNKQNTSKTILIFTILTIYASILAIYNYQYQQVWKNEHTLFSYAANIYPRSTLSLIYLANIELERKNFGKVLEIAQEINSNKKDSLLGYFYQASALYGIDKKSAIKLLLHIKPYCKSHYIYEYYYRKAMIMLIEYYSSIGEREKTIEYINEILPSPKLDNFYRYSFQGIKAGYQEKYKDAISWFKKAQKLKPNNKDIQNNIEKCLQLQKKKNL